ncbi:MAG TPA: hypothetical protein EYP10_10005 [Armatimonadetes bacterium]|nr:hypothetical protein [Armatimonadota bacterium]
MTTTLVQPFSSVPAPTSTFPTDTIVVTGYLARAGNSPFLALTIVTGEGKEGEVYEIVGPKENELANITQGTTVEVEGRIVKMGLYAPQLEVTAYRIIE